MSRLAPFLLLAVVACHSESQPAPPAPPPGPPPAPMPGQGSTPPPGAAAPPPQQNGNGNGNGGSQCDTSGDACNTVQQAGKVVTPMQVPEKAPAPTGGTILPGTYVLTETKAYTEPGGASGPMSDTEQMTLVMKAEGAGLSVQGSERYPGCPDKRENITLTFSGANVTAQRTCPPCHDQSHDCLGTHTYSVKDKMVIEYIVQEGKTWSRTFAPVAQ